MQSVKKEFNVRRIQKEKKQKKIGRAHVLPVIFVALTALKAEFYIPEDFLNGIKISVVMLGG